LEVCLISNILKEVRRTKNSVIEISKKTSKAGRTPCKFVLHEIYDSDKKYNSNGISWKKEYVEENIDSVKTMPIVAQFLDDDNSIPFGAHGELNAKDGKITFQDSLVVGAFEDAFIDENIEVNGKIITGLVAKGYIFDQRFPELVTYLQEQYDNGEPVESSVEICADKSKGNTKIIYDGGWKEYGRIPQTYQYSGHALVIGVEPSDKSALMLELNTKLNTKVTTGKEDYILSEKNNNETILNNSIIIEINEMNIDDIATLVENSFNKKINNIENEEYHYYYIHKFYPINSTFVMKSWSKVGEYYKSSYSIENSKVIIGDIIKVEESWEPVNGEQSVEVNKSLINILNNITKEENNKMDEKIVLELNQKIEDKINEINSLTKSLEAKELEVNTLTKSLEEKATEINTLTEKVKLSDEKVIELNTTIVEVNKLLESEKTEKESLIVEVNSFREEKTKLESEAKIAEVNAYFETEITKNGFEEAEVNSLKSFVDAVDLDGLKKAEAELCAKKFKEMIAKDTSVEVNTKNDMFIAIKEKDIKRIPGSIPSFFN